MELRNVSWWRFRRYAQGKKVKKGELDGASINVKLKESGVGEFKISSWPFFTGEETV